MKAATFTTEWNRMEELFDPPAKPKFRAAFLNAVQRLSDEEFHEAVTAVIESFVPTFGCPFPLPKHVYEAHNQIERANPPTNNNFTVNETNAILERQEQWANSVLKEIENLPQHVRNEIHQKAQTKVDESRRKAGIHHESRARDLAIEASMIQTYLRDYKNTTQLSPQTARQDKSPPRHEDFGTPEGHHG